MIVLDKGFRYEKKIETISYPCASLREAILNAFFKCKLFYKIKYKN